MAARAAQSVRARLAVPQHYATFPGIARNADEFAAEVAAQAGLKKPNGEDKT